jgi:hypothetical protein
MAVKFTKWTGVFFLVLGIIGLFVEHIGGLIHFDALHNAIHLLFGLWAFGAATNEYNALRYVRTVGIFYILMTIFGVVSPSMFGMMGMELSENIIHFIIGAWGLYIGFVQENITASNVSESV